MITRMKKLTLLIYYKEYEAFLTQMQQLGVLHVQAAQDGSPSSPGLEEKLALTKHVHELAVRAENLSAASGEVPGQLPDAEETVARLDRADEKRHALEQELQRMRKDEAALRPWGDFDPARVKGLQDIGYAMNFFACPVRLYDTAWEEDYCATVIRQEEGKTYFVTIIPAGTELSVNAEWIKLPATSACAKRRQPMPRACAATKPACALPLPSTAWCSTPRMRPTTG